MKAFLDTNVLIASLLTEGASRRILDEASGGRFEALVSSQVIEEADAFLRRELKLPDAERPSVLAAFRRTCTVVPIPGRIPRMSRDRTDDAILAAAEAAGADFLVTGDKDLLILRRRVRIRILSPADFLRHLDEATAR